MLKFCLVESWKTQPELYPSLKEMESWAKVVWRLKRNVSFAFLNQDLFLLEFDFPDEAKWVLENGRSFKGEFLQLEWWNLAVGCVSRNNQTKEAWLRVVGLPLHLWTRQILKMIGDSCGGLVVIDKDTILRTKPWWARVLVKLKEKGRPTSINVLAGARSYELQIW